MGASQGKIVNGKPGLNDIQQSILQQQSALQQQPVLQQSTSNVVSSKKESGMNIMAILLFICLIIAIVIVVRQRNLSQYNPPSPYLVPIPNVPI